MNLKLKANYEVNSGLIPIEGANSEKVKKARIWNFVEPIIAYAIVLIVIWTSMLEDDQMYWVVPIFGVLILWVLIFSPLVHYNYEKDVFLREDQRNKWFYVFEARGLGSARRFFYAVNGQPPLFKKYKKEIILMLSILSIIGILALISFQEEYFEILSDIGLPATPAIAIILGFVVLIVFNFVMFFGFSIMTRFDTLKAGLKHALYMIGIGIPLVLFFSLIFYLFPSLPYLTGTSVAEKFASFNILDYFGQFFGYIFWGYLQQLLFLSVFSTHFTRAFDVSKKSGQILASLFSSLFFGLIHLPVFWLSIFTWLGGFFWSMYFMRSKNLWGMGISHGALGTLLNKLTPVPFSVGPKVVL